MGTYIYRLQGPKHTARVLIEGTPQVCALLRYSHKPTWNTFGGVPKWQRMAELQMARVDSLWAGKSIPRYAVIVDSDAPVAKQGCAVIDWNPSGASTSTSCYDDPNWGNRKIIGELDANQCIVPAGTYDAFRRSLRIAPVFLTAAAMVA